MHFLRNFYAFSIVFSLLIAEKTLPLQYLYSAESPKGWEGNKITFT